MESKDHKSIGTVNIGYPSIRNFYGLKCEGYRFQKTYDLLSGYRYIMRNKMLRKVAYSRLGTLLHCDFGINRVDLLHFFNHVSISTTPWIVTFETAVPRWNPRSKFGLRLLASRQCKKLIAISQAARYIQEKILEDYPSVELEVKPKICVLHPPQKLHIQHWNEKNISFDGPLRFTIVGSDFFRKGGFEMLLVIDRLVSNGKEIHLSIVSKLRFGDYASKTTENDLSAAIQLIAKHRKVIDIYDHLPNDKVIQLFRKSHVGLLPTYGDTYGYSVLESQAVGSPVISTNVRSLPEINNDRVGWIIDVPKNWSGDGQLESAAERNIYSEILQENLYRIIIGLIQDPTTIRKKGEKCLNRIRENHCPEKNATTLTKIYDNALQSC